MRFHSRMFPLSARKFFALSFAWALGTLALNEWLIYWLVLRGCDWPEGSRGSSQDVPALILTDTHVLGRRTGHWFDKLRREWQMHRAFQTSLSLFNPETIFVLGDLTDEGWWTSQQGEYEGYIERFLHLFSMPSSMRLYGIVGNHDIGFHHMIQPDRLQWFEDTFGVDPVRMVVLKGLPFIFVNSMAMEGDGCRLCQHAENLVAQLNHSLACSKQPSLNPEACASRTLQDYVQPIIMQHFPMFRQSDAHCDEVDQAPPGEKTRQMRPRWDCLSRESTELLIESLRPRAVFTGHTHAGCLTYHTAERVPEWTVSSFSWRNRDNPAFLLAVFSADGMSVAKCFLPKETTVIWLYTVSSLLFVAWLLVNLGCWWHYSRCAIKKRLV